MTDGFSSLPPNAQDACIELRESLRSLLGEDLVALWAYGAMTSADRPKVLGDLDTYGVLTTRPPHQTARAVDALHAASGSAAKVEWDSWYVLETDARSAQPPAHALREGVVDHAWALHRAHWLAGQYIHLSGQSPGDLVKPPTWPELREGLEGELRFLERILAEGQTDAGHAAYVTANACRIIYSLERRDVVVSKRTASTWALEHLPSKWHHAIQASGRVYDGEAEVGDEAALRQRFAEIVATARERFALEDEQGR